MEKLGTEYPKKDYLKLLEIFGKNIPKEMGDVKPGQVLISQGRYLDVLIQSFWNTVLLRYENGKLVFFDFEDDVGWSGEPGTQSFLGGIIGQYKALNKPYADRVMYKAKQQSDLQAGIESIFGPK
jgi:hypothetical protein